MFYLLIILGLAQSFCFSTGKAPMPGNIPECFITGISESLQNHDAILEDEDFPPDFGSFYQAENPDFCIPYTSIISDFSFRSIIYIKHFILTFISDLPPPGCFML